jgi:hypothetical protein
LRWNLLPAWVTLALTHPMSRFIESIPYTN